MDMAVAELQDKLGKDTAVSFTADTLSSATTEDFKVVRTGAVREPFWTGASDGGSTSWLVTKSLGGASVSPEGAFTGDQVELLGTGTVGSNDLLKVSVPTEAIKVDGVDGFAADSERTIGNYGYWIGDLGVKASYAWYDQVESVSHGGYEATEYDPDVDVAGDEWFDRKERLRQMMVAKPLMTETNSDSSITEILDTNSVDQTPSNPERIDMFASDFQFRDRFGGSSVEERFLTDLSREDVEDYFHDFTPLSKGLLVDTERGGWRHDLSRDNSYEIAFSSYSNFWERIDAEKCESYDGYVLDVDSGYIPIVPSITQFNLNYAVYITEDEKLKIGLECTVEIWNPFSFAMDLNGQRLLLDVKNLQKLKIDFLNSEEGLLNTDTNDISLKDGKIALVVSSFEGSSQVLRAGQVVVLSTSGGSIEEDGDTLLTMSDGIPGRYFLVEEGISISSELDSLKLSFVDALAASVNYDFAMDLSIKGAEAVSPKDLIRIYSLPYDYTLSGSSFFVFSEIAPARFGFSWKVDDLSLLSGNEYHPYFTTLSANDIEVYQTDATEGSNTVAAFSDASAELIGSEPEEAGVTETEFDVPYLLLPKQEMTQIGQYSALTSSNATGRYSISIGEPEGSDTNNNSFFDQYFFSTIPKEPTDWKFGNTIPNSFYEARTSITSFSNNPAEDLFVHGMFNVHSTSIDAWAAILKGSPVSKHPHWRGVFDIVENVSVADDLYLFMNHPLGGEDINVLDPIPAPAVSSNAAMRASLKKNAFALTESQITTLAGLIVKEVRTHLRGTDGPFDSLEEFVNSGVIQNAIDAMDTNEATRINPTWVVNGTPGKFRQSTVLNLISGVLSVRSDTFLVRAYGDAVDPADPNKVWAKAYCEAILQRVHEEYGDVAEAPADIDRKFEIVAFRWLSPSEI